MANETLKIEEAKMIVDDFLARAKDITTSRAGNFAKYQRFILDGEQWGDVDKIPEGSDPILSFNQSEDFVTTYLSKLFPRNPETGVMAIGVKCFETDATLKEKYEKTILASYEENKLPQTLIEQAQNFLVGGAGCLYYPKTITNDARIISLDPTTVYLGWNGSQLNQFAFEDEISLSDTGMGKQNGFFINAIHKVVDLLTGETDATKRFKPVKRVTYWDTEYQIIKIGTDSIEVKKNDDGIIPFSWVPNNKKAHQQEGRSEGKMIKHLEQEYNERMSNFGKRVKDNTKQRLAAFTDMETKDIDVDDINGVLKMGKDDKASFLQVTENVEILKYTQEIANRMAVKFGINEAVQGAVKSNVSSLSMSYYFSPLLDRIGMKRIYWDEAFRELNRAIIKYKFPESKKIKTDPVYQSVMITEKSQNIKDAVMMLENRLISHKDAIDMLRGSENAVEKFKEIQEEYKALELIPGFLKNSSAQQTADTITL